jgi:formylglycine-generating enzyme required for sulfatase activity
MLAGWPFDTAAVGSFEQDVSPFGVMDMTGNAAEWTNDWFHSEYYENSPAENPQGHQQEYSEHGVKTIRGGHCLSAYEVNGLTYQRFANYPKAASRGRGFRCVMGAE